MGQNNLLTRVGIGLGIVRRTVPDSRMQSVSESDAGQQHQQQRRVAQGSAGTPQAAPRPQALNPAAPSGAPVPKPVVTAAPRITDGLPRRASETDINTVLPAAAKLNGDLIIDESIVLCCLVRGNVTQNGDHQLVLTSTGGIHGTVRAKTVVIEGAVEGDVFADRVVIRQSGVVNGNVEYATLAMQEGATVNGALKRVVPNVVAEAGGSPVQQAQAVEAPALRSVPLQENAA